MTNKELKEYINKFDDKARVSVIAANPRSRKVYYIAEFMLLTDMEQPVFIVNISGERDMDEDERNMAGKCEKDVDGQMQIEDFPEVMP